MVCLTEFNLSRKAPDMVRTGEVVAFDVETTGLSPHRGHRVIEIGAVRVVNGAFGEEFHSLIDCGGSISMSAQRIHGITPAMLHGQPQPAAVFAAFRVFIGQAPLAAHNAPFDMSFLQHEFGRLGWSLPNRSLCTLEASRRRFRTLTDYRLETIARRLLGPLPMGGRRHRALEDARLVARVWVAMEEWR
jgi:DNA polymerase III subunit epsilon